MSLEFILVIVVIRQLRKKLETAKAFPKWDKILLTLTIAAVCLLALQIAFSGYTSLIIWLSYLIWFYLIYIVFSRNEYITAKPLIFAILPYIILSLVNDILQQASKEIYKSWSNFLDAGIFFSIVWMVAMWIIGNKQKKALEKEKQIRLEEERQSKLTAMLKDQLEIQVAERTAELTQQKEELQHALTELKSTQAQLIQSEKMASLGELTAGIAHEIQNPLNFVNNFSEVSSELLEEMQAELDADNKEEAFNIAADVKQNLEKIIYHGKRADAIVKGMLQHSRSSSDKKEPVDINALTDEYLRLSYHGLRAKDKSFNATMNTDFDGSIGKINIVPQDIGRVLLNLFTNAFYSVSAKKKNLGNDYDPAIWVSTKKEVNKIIIKVRDNGTGIPQKVLDKIYQPFFTTKPTGEGTGLGLSLSYDIITKMHGGTITAETKENEFAEFTIELPV
ncbi:MAG TPA: ATP-binding protein [Panacibacter sp.]|nr:ATP-binding protein [Panacibacter sp.]